MSAIGDQAKVVLRDFAIDGIPASGQSRTTKSDLIGVFETVGSDVEALQNSLISGSIAEPLWSILSGITGTTGAKGEVYGDPGTHTDPIMTSSHAVAVTIASPAVFTWTVHGLRIGAIVTLSTTGALPTGLAVATPYYIIPGGFGANTFQLAATPGGTAINTSGSQSGTHTATITVPNIGVYTYSVSPAGWGWDSPDAVSSKAPLDGGHLTNATTTTPAPGTNTTAIATAAYVESEIATSLNALGPLYNQADIASLPGGVLGAWFVDRIGTTYGRPVIPNSAAASVGTANLFSAPRHLFASPTFYAQQGGVSVTDNAALGPFSAADAAVVSGGAADWSLLYAAANLPAGTYTLVCVVLSNTGVDQTFEMGLGSGVAVKTAFAAAYARQVTTFTHAGGAAFIHLVRANASTAGNIRLFEACLFQGSADLGTQDLVGHMVFGPDGLEGQPTYGSGVLTLSSASKFGLAQFNTKTLKAFTVLAVGRRTGNSSPAYAAILSKVQNPLDFTTMFGGISNGGLPEGQPEVLIASDFQPQMYPNVLPSPAMWNYNNGDWNVVSTRYDGTRVDVWHNDIKAIGTATASHTVPVADLFLGYTVANPTLFTEYDFNSAIIYDRALTDSEIRAAVAALTGRAARSSLVVASRNFLCLEGDSITYGYMAGTSYGYLFAPNSSPQLDGVCAANPSASLLQSYESHSGPGNSLQSRAATVNGIIPPQKNGRVFILSLLVGNEIAFGMTDMNAYAAAVATYVAGAKAAGWDKVALCTILPRTASPFNTYRNAFNTIVTGAGWAAANGVDAIIDFAANATMGPDAAASNLTYYLDGVHPTAAGHAILEPIYRSAINALG